MTRNVPFAAPDIGPDEIALVTQVLQSGTIALGPFALEFERLLAEHAGRRFAVACSSGTAGLHMAVRALGIGDGDEVITTPFSFIASSNCLLYERAIPRFVDIEEDTLGIDPSLVERAATERTCALLPVHVFGKACAIEELAGMATDRGWSLIEDACEAIGTSVGDRRLGSFGQASVYAFYPNKQITTGEGGVVLTDDSEIDAACRSMRNQGRDSDGTWLRHVQLGYNYRLDELSAALGVAQMRRRAEIANGRARVSSHYAERLAGVDGVTIPVAGAGTEVDWFVYVIRLDPTIDRDQVMRALAVNSITTRPYFQPIHLQPFYQSEFGYRPGDFPVTERVAASTLALPFSSRMTDDDIDIVVSGLIKAIDGR